MSSSGDLPPRASVAPSDSLWPDLDVSELETLRDSATPAGASEPSLLASAWDTARHWLGLARGLTLAAGSAVSCAVAAGSLAVLAFLLITASLAPANDTFSRPLSLDFGHADLAGEAVFLPEEALADGLPPSKVQQDARFLPANQAVDVWAELLVPRDGWHGLAQVQAQLRSMDGRVAAKASRVVELRPDGWSIRSLLGAPWRWVGLGGGGMRLVRVPLLTNYKEKGAVPFVVARVAIKLPRSPAGCSASPCAPRGPDSACACVSVLPQTRGTAACSLQVASGTVKVRLRLGWLRRAAYTVRPGWLALPLLGAAAAAVTLGGAAAAAVFLVLLALTGFGGGGGSQPGGEAADELGSVAGSEEAEASSGGASEVSSTLLRELSDSEGEPPSPSQQQAAAGLGPAGAGTGRGGGGRLAAREPWQEVLLAAAGPSRSSVKAAPAAPVAAQATKPRAPRVAGERPADSAMGSEPGAGGGLLGALRRRVTAAQSTSTK